MEALHTICKSTMHSGREYVKRHKSPAPLMYAYYDTEYLGEYLFEAFTSFSHHTVYTSLMTLPLTPIHAGAAHGLSGILQMLLHFPSFLKADPTAENEVRAAVDFMLSLMQPNGNIAPAMDEVPGMRGARQRPESEELVHWCHGAPGETQAYHITHHSAYISL